MHLSMIFVAVALAWLVRLCWSGAAGTWAERWQRALGLFLSPPLLLLATGLAILWMGPQGNMMGLHVGWGSYGAAGVFLSFASGWCFWLIWQGWRSLQQVQTYPLLKLAPEIGEGSGHILNTPILFAAQVGFWQPKLVVSQGLLKTLSTVQLQAVLTHEQAHCHYRDTFWFFWLGWIRQITAWLPNTEALWQELLLLRELRADQWAAQRVDTLLLAESLLLVVQSPLVDLNACAAFSTMASVNRLEERIEALMTSSDLQTVGTLPWVWLLLAFLPLLTVPFHA